ncbi:hypothetical protein IAQ61_001952 [Plenodomus lingam]|uniref:uncharacterized protein n=1 Tax=Leptosphaeria maculans TaxID=5022 RepID=UPI003324C207|nr:hypothetical protein IAQ61_001952 [Plenodomus lingam]
MQSKKRSKENARLCRKTVGVKGKDAWSIDFIVKILERFGKKAQRDVRLAFPGLQRLGAATGMPSRGSCMPCIGATNEDCVGVEGRGRKVGVYVVLHGSLILVLYWKWARGLLI